MYKYITNLKMEKRAKPINFVPLEELITKVKSLADLYTVMSVDSKYYLILTYSELLSPSIW